MEIRQVRPDEYEEAGRVTARAYEEFGPARRRSGGSDLNLHDWDQYMALMADVAGRADRTLVLVAVEDGVVLGTATLELEDPVDDDPADRLAPGAASLRMLGVDPAARGRGIGRALVEACVERARAEGKDVLTLRTTTVMRVAREMYERMGFRRDEPNDYPLRRGPMLYAYRLPLR
jgi:ribosomal protein S18 acetylase RimI-like enzyme